MSDRTWVEVWCRTVDVPTVDAAFYGAEDESEVDEAPGVTRLSFVEVANVGEGFQTCAEAGVICYGISGDGIGFEPLAWVVYDGQEQCVPSDRAGFPTIRVDPETGEPSKRDVYHAHEFVKVRRLAVSGVQHGR